MLVIGGDLGAAVGPMLGYAILQCHMPPSSILLTQATLHATAAFVGCCSTSRGGRARSGRLRLNQHGDADGPTAHAEGLHSSRALPGADEPEVELEGREDGRLRIERK